MAPAWSQEQQHTAAAITAGKPENMQQAADNAQQKACCPRSVPLWGTESWLADRDAARAQQGKGTGNMLRILQPSHAGYAPFIGIAPSQRVSQQRSTLHNASRPFHDTRFEWMFCALQLASKYSARRGSARAVQRMPEHHHQHQHHHQHHHHHHHHHHQGPSLLSPHLQGSLQRRACVGGVETGTARGSGWRRADVHVDKLLHNVPHPQTCGSTGPRTAAVTCT